MRLRQADLELSYTDSHEYSEYLMARTDYHWERAVKRIRAYPNHWVLTHQNVPVTAARRVRLRQHPALVTEDGRIETILTDRYMDELGTNRANLWLRFIPKEDEGADEDSDQHRG
jgi:hypothetical protein